MDRELSPQTEEYPASIVAGSLFTSKEAALEAAEAALRERTEPISFVPDKHMARVEVAIESANAGLTSPTTPTYWDGLRQDIRDMTG